MEKSESIKLLAEALNKFQGAIKPVPRTEVNPFYNSSYADLASIWDAIRSELHKNGLSVVQTFDGPLLVTCLLHVSGEWISGSLPVCAKDASAQAQGSAITYARRYALAAILGISTEEDDDGNQASKPDKKAPTKTPQPKTEDLQAALAGVKGQTMDGIKEISKRWDAACAASRADIDTINTGTVLIDAAKNKLIRSE